MLTNREWATMVWVGIIAAYVLREPDVRGSLRAVLGALLTPKIIVSIAAFVAWMILVVWIAAQFGAWKLAMLKNTVLWAVPGAAFVVASSKAATEPGYFRRRVASAIGLTAVLEFYLNSATFDLIWELVLQPVLFLAVGVSVVAGKKREYAPARGVANGVLFALVLLLFIPPTARLVSDWGTIIAEQTLLDFALPVWLTVAALPFVYVLSLLSSYEQVFMHMRSATQDRPVPRKAKLALFSKLHVRLGAVSSFAGKWPGVLAEAESLREARRVIDEQQRERREQEATKR